MKQLTCEMCGSTDLLKQDGVFVCQTCGTKYSVEEAKKMMIEGTVNVSGTVRVDNTDKIKNYLEMAKSAYDAGNKGEAESYCNRIIEIEPQNYEAWFMKGKAAGWQSTLANIRIEESVQCFSKAIDYAPDEKKVSVQKSCADEVAELSTALMRLCCNNFSDFPSENNVATIKNCGIITLNVSLQFLVKCGITVTEFTKAVANLINNSAIDAYINKIKPDFKSNKYPNKHQLSTFLDGAGYVSSLILYAITYSGEEDYEANIVRYKNLIDVNDECISAKSYNSEYLNYDRYNNGYWAVKRMEDAVRRDGNIPDSANSRYWYVDTKLSASAISSRKTENDTYRKKIQECTRLAAIKRKEEAEKKAKEQTERNNTYWAEHAEEKRQLESERNTLQAQLKQLQEQVAPYDRDIAKWQKKREADTPAQEEKKTVEKQISDLRTEKNNLGIFKGKEKKALQAQIDELSSRLPAINESIEVEEKEQIKMCNGKIREIDQQAKPIKDKIAAAEKRINEIKAELTKNR